MKRRYTLAKRAGTQAETRRRIVETTVALHQEVGPAATQIAQIARRAGVQRQTVYRHFPAESELLAACSAHWRSLHPMPDPHRWERITDPGERLRAALAEIYAWYRETQTMTANVLRDSASVPPLRQIITGGLLASLDRLAGMLVEPIGVTGERAERVTLVARAAVDFDFWRLLEPLGDEEAASIGANLIEQVRLAGADPLPSGD